MTKLKISGNIMIKFDTDMFKTKTKEKDFKKYRTTFYGEAGVGKTSLVNELYDKPIFLAFERGQNSLEEYISVELDTWKELKTLIRYWSKLKKEGFEFPNNVVVIDTVDVAVSRCQDYVCEINGIEHPSDLDYGKGWSAFKKEYNSTLDDLAQLGFYITRICHEKKEEVKPEVGESYHQIQPNIGSTAWGNTVDDPDFCCYIRNVVEKTAEGKINSRRELWFRNEGICLAKSRNPNIVEKIECGSSARETAERFKEAVENALQVEETQNEKPKKETTKKTKKSEKVEEVVDVKREQKPIEEVKEKATGIDLSNIKQEILDLGIKLIQEDKKITNTDMKDLIVSISQKQKLGDVDSLEQCEEILKNLKEM